MKIFADQNTKCDLCKYRLLDHSTTTHCPRYSFSGYRIGFSANKARVNGTSISYHKGKYMWTFNNPPLFINIASLLEVVNMCSYNKYAHTSKK